MIDVTAVFFIVVRDRLSSVMSDVTAMLCIDVIVNFSGCDV